VIPKTDANGCIIGYGCEPSSDCEALEQEYLATLELAKSCSPMLAVVQCETLVDNRLTCPCGQVFVNNLGNNSAVQELFLLKATWQKVGCGDNYACPAIACPAPASGTCSPLASDPAVGQCQTSNGIP
jgi:hypothetical protein